MLMMVRDDGAWDSFTLDNVGFWFQTNSIWTIHLTMLVTLSETPLRINPSDVFAKIGCWNVDNFSHFRSM